MWAVESHLTSPEASLTLEEGGMGGCPHDRGRHSLPRHARPLREHAHGPWRQTAQWGITREVASLSRRKVTVHKKRPPYGVSRGQTSQRRLGSTGYSIRWPVTSQRKQCQWRGGDESTTSMTARSTARSLQPTPSLPSSLSCARHIRHCTSFPSFLPHPRPCRLAPTPSPGVVRLSFSPC